MKLRFFKYPGLFVVSVILSCMLWVIVVNVDDPTVTRAFTQVDVELLNAGKLTSDGEYYEVADNTDLITVVATGKRSIIDSMSRDNFKATADMDKREGSLVPIEVRATKYADLLDSVSARTTNVKLDIEGFMDKYVSIEVVTEGEVEEGSILGDVSLERTSVHISGPESVLESIVSASITVDVTGVSSDISTSGEIELLDADGDEVEDDRISSNVTTATVTVEVWKSKEVPIVYSYQGTPATGYGFTGESYVEPSTVSIAAPKNVLHSISEIAIPAGAVDVNGAMSNLDIPVNITNYIPKDAVLYGQSDADVMVHIGVSALLTKNIQVPTANISIINVPDGYEATIAEPNDFIIAYASGIGNNFINLDAATVLGEADLSSLTITTDEDNLENNVYDIPVTFAYPEGVVQPQDMTVKILVRSIDSANDNEAQTNVSHEADNDTGDEADAQ